MDSASSLGGDGIDSTYAPRRFHRHSFSGYGAFELFIMEGLPQNKGLFQLRKLLAHFSSLARCGSGAKRTGLALARRGAVPNAAVPRPLSQTRFRVRVLAVFEGRDTQRYQTQPSRSVLEPSSAIAPLGVLM